MPIGKYLVYVYSRNNQDKHVSSVSSSFFLKPYNNQAQREQFPIFFLYVSLVVPY